MLNIIINPNHKAHSVWSKTYSEFLTNVITINYRQTPFPNTRISFLKILDVINVFKIVYLLSRIIYYRSVNKGKINVFFFGPELSYFLLIVSIRLLTNCKVWYMLHEPYIESQKGVKIKIVNIFNSIICKVSNKIILTSEEALNIAERYYSSNKQVLIKFAYAEIEKKIPELNETANQFYVNSNNIFSYYGSAVKSKRPERMNMIYNILCHKDIPFKVIRAGKDIGVTVQYSAGIEVVDTYISEEEKNQLLIQSKVIVLPYDSISQSGIIIEALGYGKIILANSIKAFDFFKACRSVYLVDFNKIDDMSNVIDKIISLKQDEYDVLSKASQLFFMNNFSTQQLQNRFIELGLNIEKNDRN